ncbi:hypothetical protein PTT_18565 [Pyrenophora teres f. teres 0-1]|uniref:Carboxylic ester hydrolase n=1 Tax=Pyrenophora teres f. teres (strain 0-1) TaxID=861557 RepID=E3S701_PYRTT|nr:hypothetical protein PTT_18565 [Pyrenophora teres f. teres 0-1]KAE8849592.1 hypothetical protein PTNB85_00008 [Pyrenophora teres f. teres]
MHLPQIPLLTSLSAVLLSLHSQQTIAPHTPVVAVKNGSIAGIHNAAYAQDFFLGIPYATPPTGPLRLLRPQPALAWNGTRQATSYPPWCAGTPGIQLVGFTQPGDTGEATASEDCLYLNIVRPAGLAKPTSPLPVMVWIHGGGWMTGSSADARYNGTFLVQKSVDMGTPLVFVSINYRLGTFGFLAGAAVERAGLTNNGYRDQRLALAWIQENIAAFGGDPGRVTIVGESAGAGSVAAQIVAFGGKEEGLFHGAIMQSGTAAAGQPFLNATAREARFQSVLNATACGDAEDVVQCLQNVPRNILATANPTQSVLFTVNDDFFPELPSTLLAQGRFAHVPVILGTNRNDGSNIFASLVTALKAPVNTIEDFTAVLISRGYTASVAQKLWDLYGDEIDNPTEAGLDTMLPTQGPELGSEFPRVSLWVGDEIFAFARRMYNQIWDKAGVPSYSYFFDVPPADSFLNTSVYGVPHFAEIPYVFGNSEAVGWEKNPIRQGDDKDRYEKVVDLMSRMWVSFAVHGSPNEHGLSDVNVAWPEYSCGNPTNAWFKASGLTTQVDDWRTEAMDIYKNISVGILW